MARVVQEEAFSDNGILGEAFCPRHRQNSFVVWRQHMENCTSSFSALHTITLSPTGTQKARRINANDKVWIVHKGRSLFCKDWISRITDSKTWHLEHLGICFSDSGQCGSAHRGRHRRRGGKAMLHLCRGHLWKEDTQAAERKPLLCGSCRVSGSSSG